MTTRSSHPATVLGVVALASLVGCLEAADLKIGVVSFDKVFDEYYKTKQAELTLKDEAAAYKKERDQLMDDLKKGFGDLDKIKSELNRPELSAAAKFEKTREKESKENDLRRQQIQFDEFEKFRSQQFDDRKKRAFAGLTKEINEQVAKFAKTHEFTLVVDGRTTLYFQEALDLTSQVIQELNKNAPPPAPAPAATPAPASTPAPAGK